MQTTEQWKRSVLLGALGKDIADVATVAGELLQSILKNLKAGSLSRAQATYACKVIDLLVAGMRGAKPDKPFPEPETWHEDA